MLPGLHRDCPAVCALSTPCRDRRDCKFNLNQTEPQTLQANLGVQGYWALCSLKCKEQFLKNWLRLHFEVAAQRLGEPNATSMTSPYSGVVEASTEFAFTWYLANSRCHIITMSVAAIRQLQIWQVSASVKTSPEKARP